MCLCRISIFESTTRKFPTEEDLGSVYRRYFIFFDEFGEREKKKERKFKSFFSVLQPHPLGLAAYKPSAVSVSVHAL